MTNPVLRRVSAVCTWTVIAISWYGFVSVMSPFSSSYGAQFSAACSISSLGLLLKDATSSSGSGRVVLACFISSFAVAHSGVDGVGEGVGGAGVGMAVGAGVGTPVGPSVHGFGVGDGASVGALVRAGDGRGVGAPVGAAGTHVAAPASGATHPRGHGLHATWLS